MPTTPRPANPSGALHPIAEPLTDDDEAAATIGAEVLELHTGPEDEEARLGGALTPRNHLVASDVAWMASLMQTLSTSLQDGGRWMNGFDMEDR